MKDSTLLRMQIRLTAFNKEVEQWQDSVTTQLKAAIGSRSLRIARELEPKAYTDNYGLINRLGFSFPRHGVYIHKGAGRGQGGFIGSKWSYLKRINGIEINTSIIRHTNPASLGKQDEGNRRAYRWFDPVIKNRLPEPRRHLHALFRHNAYRRNKNIY
ncbi:hypothetical protein NXX60_26415 [Bacteroides thetaiotaomicron]|nr:hypothetical protein NXX60_26415 [Bacteroides thetaiotaomicron]